MIKIFAYNIKKNINNNFFKIAKKILSETEKKHTTYYKRKTDQLKFIIGRYILRVVLSKYLNILPKEIKIVISKYGKPKLENVNIKKIDFNISHSGDWVVVALNTNGKIGIDIEKIRGIKDINTKNIFCNEERDYIYKNDIIDLNRFFDIWVLKESYIKAKGLGLSYPLKNFYFKIDSNINFISSNDKKKWFFKLSNDFKGYKLAICSDKKINNKKIKIIKI